MRVVAESYVDIVGGAAAESMRWVRDDGMKCIRTMPGREGCQGPSYLSNPRVGEAIWQGVKPQEMARGLIVRACELAVCARFKRRNAGCWCCGGGCKARRREAPAQCV